VADAARYHFDKAAHELDLLEAVHLAALAPGPRLFSKKFASGQVDDEWMAELRHQIRRMYLHGRISREAMRAALRSRLVLVDHTAGESA
jgi:membrane peptidoglycan carboxypeptidase